MPKRGDTSRDPIDQAARRRRVTARADRYRPQLDPFLLARLAPPLPYLRRYACALSGSQKIGDEQIRVALETLASGERQLDASMSPRMAVYHLLNTVWQPDALPLGADVEPTPEAPLARLAR